MKRPLFLTIWLCLIVVADLFSLFRYLTGGDAIRALLPAMPSWGIPALIVFLILQLIAAYLVWQWKKLGFYIFVVTAIGSLFVNYPILGLQAIIYPVVGIAILYFAMKPVWNEFK